MANPFSNLLEMLRLGDDEDYDYDFDEEFDEEIDPDEAERLIRKDQKRREREERKTARQSTFSRDMEEEYEEPEVPVAPRRTSVRTSSNKVVPIRTTTRGLEVCICKPNNFGDSQDACEMLIQGHAVVVNLEGIDIMEAQRIMDFISGCIFSMSGKMHQISRYIFIFSPENVDISGDYLELSEKDDFSFPTLNKEF